MELAVEVRLVVESVDVHRVAEILSAGPRIVAAEACKSCGILIMTHFREVVGDAVFLRIALLAGLVADAPDDD